MKKQKSKKQKPEAHLGKEVAMLANQVVAAIKSSGTGKEVRALSGEALGTLRATGSRLVKALRKDTERQSVQDIKSQTQRVLDLGKKETEKATKNFRVNLAKGLQKIGQELNNLGENLRKK